MNQSSQPMTGVAAIVFDLDGVLVDSFAVMRQAFARAYAEVVGPGEPPFETYRRHMGRYFPEIMRLMGLPPELEGPFMRVSAELTDQVTVYDGIRSLLAELRAAGLRLAVATGKSGPRARTLLGRLDLLASFDAVIGSDEVPRPKPAPDIVLRALHELGTYPDAAMMVGDAPTDIRSARGARVRSVAAMWGTTDAAALLRALPDVVAYRPADVSACCPREWRVRRQIAAKSSTAFPSGSCRIA
jgi:AHBA synthesis associated protein